MSVIFVCFIGYCFWLFL